MDSLGMKVDCKLFVTCRLCLENEGVYQIVPAVQDQIKFCFDIIVEHFDGLPQLLCTKCKLLLNEYSLNKKNFINKQETLKQKLEEKLRQDQTAAQSKPEPNVSIDPGNDFDSKTEREGTKHIDTNKGRNRILSSSTDSSIKPTRKKRKQKRKCDAETCSIDLKRNYGLNYMCRLCSKGFAKRSSVIRHYKNTHAYIKYAHRKILDSPCTVNLVRIDNKPNKTGLKKSVALTKEKIVQDDGAKFHYIVYTALNKSKSDSDSDEALVFSKRNKKLRLNSLSSTDTLHIGDNNEDNDKSKVPSSQITNVEVNKQSEPKDTIYIDDSSDGETSSQTSVNHSVNVSTKTGDINNSVKTYSENIEIDEKVINDIISVCRKKFDSRKNVVSADIESNLKRDVLAVGRKTFSGQSGYSCSALLKYLEHKNLGILWGAKSQTHASVSKEANYIRIHVKNCKPFFGYDDAGWVDAEEQNGLSNTISSSSDSSATHTIPAQRPVEQNRLGQTHGAHQVQIVIQQPKMVVQKSPIVQLKNEQHSPIMQNSQSIQQVVQPSSNKLITPLMQTASTQKSGTDQAVLYDVSFVDDSNTKKILNPNAVANPKQLPKKTYLNDTKPVIAENISNEPVFVKDDTLYEENNEENMMLPVITSTTSLAEVNDIDSNSSYNVNNPNNAERPLPRIKVKPVSELMNPLSMIEEDVNGGQPTNIWGVPLDPQDQTKDLLNNDSSNIFVPNNLVAQIQSQSTLLPNVVFPASNYQPDQSEVAETTKNSTDSIILDTVDFPNTRTDSPFKYFRNVLLLHDIILTEANAVVSRDFVCLLKFKVQFKQENKNLTLSLSLYCSNNTFCMRVKDSNDVNIHMGKMSANWQWEIMKVFKGDVTSKILQNAQKSSQQMYNKTKTFLCLLKSINQK